MECGSSGWTLLVLFDTCSSRLDFWCESNTESMTSQSIFFSVVCVGY